MNCRTFSPDRRQREKVTTQVIDVLPQPLLCVLLGMFAVATDHAAKLTRHLPDWMQWTANSLRLAWLGFHDRHSGIDSYRVHVGSSPFASDLNIVSRFFFACFCCCWS